MCQLWFDKYEFKASHSLRLYVDSWVHNYLDNDTVLGFLPLDTTRMDLISLIGTIKVKIKNISRQVKEAIIKLTEIAKTVRVDKSRNFPKKERTHW